MRILGRTSAAALASALIASSLLAGPILAARPSTGGSTTLTVSATPSALVVGSPTTIEFKVNTTPPTTTRVKIRVATSYSTPQIAVPFDSSTVAGLGYVTDGDGEGQEACGITVAGQDIEFSAGTDCTKILYTGRTAATGGAKFPVFLNGSSSASQTLTLNASSAKVSVSLSQAAVTTGDYVIATARVTNSKNLPFRGVSVVFTDNLGSSFTDGTVACVDQTEPTFRAEVACSATDGTVRIRIDSTVAGQHQIRATVLGTSYSGQRSYAVLPGAMVSIDVTSATSEITAGTVRRVSLVAYDEHGNETSTGASPVTFSQTAGTGSVEGLANVQYAAWGAFVDVTAWTGGEVTIEGSVDIDSMTTTDNVTFSVTTGDVATVELAGPATVDVGAIATYTVTAEDVAGNAIDLAAATITVASSDITYLSDGVAGTTLGDFDVTGVADSTAATVSLTATVDGVSSTPWTVAVTTPAGP